MSSLYVNKEHRAGPEQTGWRTSVFSDSQKWFLCQLRAGMKSLFQNGSNISFSRKWSPNHFRISFPFHCVPKTQATCLCSMTVPSFVLYSSFTLPKFSLAQPFLTGFPAGLVVKYPAANAGDSSSVPESGRSPGRENGSPLQYSCLGNPMVEQPGGL